MLKKELERIIGEYDADIAVLVENLNTEEIVFNFNEDKIFPSASLIKIPIMIEALHRVDNLEMPLLNKIKIKESDKVDFSIITEQNLTECSILELITWMVISSDNTAANILIDYIGMDNVNNKIKVLGMKNTKLQRKMMDFSAIKEGKDNITTLKDIWSIMRGLYKGEIINKEIAKKALDIMKNQRDNLLLKRYILENVSLANKTGELDSLNHDVGIFYTKPVNYFIGVLVNKANSNQEASKIIGSISKKVYDYFMDINHQCNDFKIIN